MGVRHTGLGTLVAILLTGCSTSVDGQATVDRTPSATGTSTTKAVTPTASDTGIPAELVLPGQADGTVEPPTDAGRLYDYICLDPEQQWTLGTGFVEARTVVTSDGRGGGRTIEKLAAYATPSQAVRAVRGLRAQVELCGDGSDHVGDPMTWRAAELTGLPGADEALRLTYCSDGVVVTVVTVARVGRAVYYVDRRQQYAAGVAAAERTVAAFVPTLTKAFH